MIKLIIKKLFCFLLFYFSIEVAHSKFMNLKIDLLSRAVGGTNIELDFLSNKFSVGPAYYGLDLSLPDWRYEAELYGGQISFHAESADSDGWLATGKYLNGKFEITYTKTNLVYIWFEPNVSVLFGYLGYQWMWDNFNIQLKFGQSKYDILTTLNLKASDGSTLSKNIGSYSGTNSSFEFRLGLAF